MAIWPDLKRSGLSPVEAGERVTHYRKPLSRKVLGFFSHLRVAEARPLSIEVFVGNTSVFQNLVSPLSENLITANTGILHRSGGYLEKLHAGKTPITKTGDYSDVKVIDAAGQEIPWTEVSRIDQAEMKDLITGIVNRIHTFLARTSYCSFNDEQFNRAMERCAAPWTKVRDEPKYLPEYLMPQKEEESK